MLYKLLPNRVQTGGSFVVVLSEALPASVTEFSLIFEGISSKNRISGKAVPVDTKTLIGTVGGDAALWSTNTG